MAPTLPNPGEGEWFRPRSDVHRLYLAEKKPLEQVRKDQLDLKLKQRDFQKNLAQNAWRSIDDRIGKRERLGKQSSVRFRRQARAFSHPKRDTQVSEGPPTRQVRILRLGCIGICHQQSSWNSNGQEPFRG